MNVGSSESNVEDWEDGRGWKTEWISGEQVVNTSRLLTHLDMSGNIVELWEKTLGHAPQNLRGDDLRARVISSSGLSCSYDTTFGDEYAHCWSP